jgi:MFS family permease
MEPQAATTVSKHDAIELTQINGPPDSTFKRSQSPAPPGPHSPTSDTGSLADETTSAAENEASYPTGFELWLILANIGSALILGSIESDIVATAVPSITDHFHTVADIGWYTSAFRLCVCAFQFMFGKAYTLFSIKNVFLLGNVISIAGALLSGSAATSAMLVFGCAVSGVGHACLLSGCFIILLRSVPLRRRPFFLGIMAGVEGVASVSAPLLGGVLTQTIGWRWCFYINAPTGAVTLLLTLFGLSGKRNPGRTDMTLKEKIRELDIVSNLVFIPAMTSLFLALSWAGTKYPWSSGEVIGPLVTFVALVGAFIYNQFRRGSAAALPPRVMRSRTVIAGFIFIVCVNSAGTVLQYYLPTYYQVVRGYSPAKSGYMMLPIIIGGVIGALIHGAGTSAFGYYTPFMIFASIIMPISAGLITQSFKVNSSLAELILYTGLSGLGYGIGFTGPNNAVQTVLPAEDVPLGISVILFAQSFGPAISVAVGQVIFTNQLTENLQRLVPGLNQTSIVDTGLTDLVTSVPPGDVKQVLAGVDKSLVQTWYLVVGLSCTMIVGSLMTEWRSVKTKRE